MQRRAWCALALSVAAGCRSDGGVPVAGSVLRDTTPTVAVSVMDSLPADWSPYEAADIDSVRQALDSLEARLAAATQDDIPSLLLQLGRVKAQYRAPRGTPHGAYAETLPEDFWYDEIAGDYLYTGKDLRELIERFPGHALVDDAAYSLTLLPRGGECEGFVTCYIASSWSAVRPFLEEYGTSPYATRALDRIIDSFEQHLSQIEDLSVTTDDYDPAELVLLVAEFEAVTARLPEALRERASAVSGRIRQRLVPRSPEAGFVS